jgi:hypothetical protein
MKVLFSVVVSLALACVFGFTAVDSAKAQCASPCGAVLVPAPNPIPLGRLIVRPAPAPLPAPCGVGCAGRGIAYGPPPPCGQAGCGGTPFVYFPTRFYAYWKQPGYTACFPGPGNCYWRRDCWYDSFGRRFCN